jgi:hypothetical protein
MYCTTCLVCVLQPKRGLQAWHFVKKSNYIPVKIFLVNPACVADCQPAAELLKNGRRRKTVCRVWLCIWIIRPPASPLPGNFNKISSQEIFSHLAGMPSSLLILFKNTKRHFANRDWNWSVKFCRDWNWSVEQHTFSEIYRVSKKKLDSVWFRVT